MGSAPIGRASKNLTIKFLHNGDFLVITCYAFCMETIINSVQSTYSEFNWLLAIGVLLAYLLVDAMYAYYTLSITKRKAIAAATTGALMHFLLALGVLSYVQNYLYIVPIAIGSWIGTYLIMKRESAQYLASEA